MHDVIVATFDHADIHHLAPENGGELVKMVEAAALGHGISVRKLFWPG
jgi:hypothetical protein